MTEPDRQTSTYSLEKTIRYRLLAVMLPLLLVLVVIIHESVHLLVDELVVDRLKQDSQSLISSLKKQEDDRWDVEELFLPHVYQRVRSGHYFILQWQTGQIRSRSLWDKRVDPADFTAGDREDYLYFSVDEESWVVLKQVFSRGGENFTLWIAEDISEISRKQFVYEYTLLAVSLVFVGLFVLWQRHVLKKNFSRLEPIQKVIKGNRDDGELRFPQEIPEEIKPLVDSIIVLVERSAEQVSRSRMSVGNLAHELKRPLQELQIMADEVGDTDTKAQLTQLYQQLQSRVDSELRRARISGNPMPGNMFTFENELPHLQTLLDRIHGRSIAFESEVDAPQIPFDRDDMLELLGNLLDNAWKYAKSKVVLKVERNGQGWCFSVEDDGPGVSDSEISRVNGRGIRVDEDQQQKGHGLGLSICQTIVNSYNGTLSHSRSDMGGFKAQAVLKNKLVD